MTSATTTAQPDPINGPVKARRGFRDWRRTRPFWGGLLIVLSSGPILYFPYATLNVGALRIQMATTAGAGSAVIGLLLLALGISCWFQPLIRIFAGIAAIVLSIVSLPVSNFGGFGMGVILGILGGALACSWAPLKEPALAAAPQQPMAPPGMMQPAMAQPEMAQPVVAEHPAEAGTAQAVAAEADTQVVLPTQQAGEAETAAQPTAAPEAQQPQQPQEESKSVE